MFGPVMVDKPREGLEHRQDSCPPVVRSRTGGVEARAHILHAPIKPERMFGDPDEAVAFIEVTGGDVDGVDHDQPGRGASPAATALRSASASRSDPSPLPCSCRRPWRCLTTLFACAVTVSRTKAVTVLSSRSTACRMSASCSG